MTDAAPPPLAVPPGLALAPDEKLRALFRPDLDAGLRYAESVVVLTSRRLCWQPAGGGWSSLDVAPAVVLERREYAGLGELRIVDGGRTVARFFHTLAVGKDATLLWDAFAEQKGTAPALQPSWATWAAAGPARS